MMPTNITLYNGIATFEDGTQIEATVEVLKAAPDLKEALELTLESLLNWLELQSEEDKRAYDDFAVAKARAALAKAKP